MANGTVWNKGAGLNYWGPTMNIGRSPRWGRFQESVSECPYLNAAYVARFVHGMQGADDAAAQPEARPYTKIAACCKHYYAYSLEDSDGFTRHNFSANVSKRDLSETYLPAFRACAAACAEQIMCSYSSVNGVPTPRAWTGPPALTKQLRGDFGYGSAVWWFRTAIPFTMHSITLPGYLAKTSTRVVNSNSNSN